MVTEIFTVGELEDIIIRLKHKLKKGEKAKLILHDINLLTHVARLSTKYGLSFINAEEIHENKVIIEFENSFR